MMGTVSGYRASCKKTSAHDRELQQDKLPQGHKAERSLAIQLRTEKMGFATFLHACRVPDAVFPAYQYGWRDHHPKHIIMFRLNHTYNRRRLFKAVETD